MIIYGSSPDSLAQQQLAYTQLYANTGQQNAARADAAAARNLNAILDTRRQDIASQQFDQNNLANQQRMAWQSQQNELNRLSAQRNTDVQYGAVRNNQVNNDFKLAFQSAVTLPTDKQQLKKLYPQFSDTQIDQLSNQADAAKFYSFLQRGEDAAKQGAYINPNDVGQYLSPDSKYYDQAVKQTLAWAQPQQQEHQREQSYIDTSKRLARILQERSDAAQPVSSGISFWSEPMSATANSIANIFKSYKGAEANPGAQQRAEAMASNIAPMVQLGTKSSVVSLGPTGQIVPITPSPFPTQAWAQNNPQNVVAPNPAQSNTGTSSANEVARKTKDGRIAIFDAVTKQFLRYGS